MALNKALILEDVTQITTTIQPELLDSPAFVNEKILTELGINVISGVEYQNLLYQSFRKGGTTRPYNGTVHYTETGKLAQRMLKVGLSTTFVKDNIQNYREKEPFHVDTDGKYTTTANVKNVQNIMTTFAEDIMLNVAFGKRDEESTYETGSVLDNMDGILELAYGNGQLAENQVIETDPFLDVTADAPSANWDILKAFVGQLPPQLRLAMKTRGLNIHVNEQVNAQLIDSYCRTYPSLQPKEVGELTLDFIGLRGVHIKAHDIWGEGSMMFATVPGNIDFGVDSLNNLAAVDVDIDPYDHNNLLYQIQSAQGMRIRDPRLLAFNNQANTFDAATWAGDYNDESKKVTFNPESGRSVA